LSLAIWIGASNFICVSDVLIVALWKRQTSHIKRAQNVSWTCFAGLEQEGWGSQNSQPAAMGADGRVKCQRWIEQWRMAGCGRRSTGAAKTGPAQPIMFHRTG